jgi:hypothetical protein
MHSSTHARSSLVEVVKTSVFRSSRPLSLKAYCYIRRCIVVDRWSNNLILWYLSFNESSCSSSMIILFKIIQSHRINPRMRWERERPEMVNMLNLFFNSPKSHSTSFRNDACFSIKNCVSLQNKHILHEHRPRARDIYRQRGSITYCTHSY